MAARTTRRRRRPPLPNPRRSSPAWWLLRDDRTRSHPELGRQTSQRPWYCVSRPGRVGRRQARQDRRCPSLLTPSTCRRCNNTDGHDAGWSSPVARQAHNLKAAGSNPAPATTSHDTTSAPRNSAGPKCVQRHAGGGEHVSAGRTGPRAGAGDAPRRRQSASNRTAPAAWPSVPTVIFSIRISASRSRPSQCAFSASPRS